MCAAKEQETTEKPNDRRGDSEPQPRSEDDDISLDLLLLALMSAAGGTGRPLLPRLLPGLLDKKRQKASRIQRSALLEKYGQDAGRFRETTGNIAAIDFGTTFCSLAFKTSVSSDMANLKLNEVYSRVPTAILLRQREGSASMSSGGLLHTPQYDVYKFGYAAQDEHKKMRKEERARSLYFERFKMELQKDAVSTDDSSSHEYNYYISLLYYCSSLVKFNQL